MKNKTILLLSFLVFSLCKSANVYAADKHWNGYSRENKININYNQYNSDKKDKIDEEWEIVPHNYDTQSNKEDDLELKLKAAGNTALSIAGSVGMAACGMGVLFLEKIIQHRADQFTAAVVIGSSLYEKEKNLLKEQDKKM